ncbi:MAG TPA: flagellar hook-length control protein FliK [Planctomycetota bacterium]|nr:flagellar hook-length control protein FliK [Planctomycetota bacterium]
MRVPQAATMARPDDFDAVLQQRVEADASLRAAPAPTPPAAEPVAKEPAPVEDQAAEEPPEEPHVEAGEHAAGDAPPEAVAHVQAASEPEETPRRGESVRQETAGKGADSPRQPSRPASSISEQLLVAAVQRTVGNAAGPAVEPAAGVQAVAGGGAVREAMTHGIDGPGARTSLPARAPTVTAGYRTNAAASAELLEQARDSVFKQILMKLNQDGGEMRMRLEPPELGELDLRLLVEGGNKLSLTIAAERQDMAQLLQRHLDELRQSLQGAGLDVTSAQVQTRGEFARQQQQADARHGGGGSAFVPAEERARPAPRGGYISAEGLDFWA